jgi:cell wall-associated NlpC family hydrolase
MAAIATAKAVGTLYRFKKPIAIAVISFFGVIFLIASGVLDTPSDNPAPSSIGAGKAKVSPLVTRYEPAVAAAAKKYGLSENYVPILLAKMMQESGGRLPDVMQSSESIQLGRNAIKDPMVSIDVGVKYFSEVLKEANGDVKLSLQSYNFGKGFISYANKRGGYSKENAVAFSNMMAAKKGWRRYGDINYVDHVLRYYEGNVGNSATANAQPVSTNGSGGQNFDVNKVYSDMAQYLGDKYVWGGASPATGFDCSGLMQWNYAQSGIKLPRTAQLQYNAVTKIDKNELRPGDMVFFAGTYAGPTVTHVGMYIGNGKMINSSSSGVNIANVFTGYWGQHYYASGRPS